MEYLKFIIYGLIQGLTEFIPISSTAHLKVISHFFGIEDPGPSLSAFIQLGSVLALIWYFRNDIFNIKKKYSKNFFTYLFYESLIRSILIGTLPIVLFGMATKLFFSDFFNEILRSNLSIAIISILMAIFMYVADRSRKGSINLKNQNFSNTYLIGLAQAFALIPGVSRSGVTISTALISGWDRGDAAKFSFLLGIPAISLAGITELIFSFNQIFSYSLFFPIVVCLATTFLSSLLAIDFLVSYVSSNGLKLFIIYRVIFGVVILLNL